MVSCLRLGRKNSFLLVFVCLVCSLLVSCVMVSRSAIYKRDLSPNDFGLSRARSGEERFRVLYKTHSAAVKAGVNVSYAGIKHIDLEIPQDAVSIPLTENNDFAGVEFRVRNVKKNFNLFCYLPKFTSVAVSKSDIDKGDFRRYSQLAHGRVLLTVSDDNPWVENRAGMLKIKLKNARFLPAKTVQAQEIIERLSIPRDTLNKILKVLTDRDLIARRGSKKTCGYYAK